MVELRATVTARLLRETLGGVASEPLNGDNLAILLASYFEPQVEDDELDEYDCWKQGAESAIGRLGSFYIYDGQGRRVEERAFAALRSLRRPDEGGA